ncbi:hypothetical protein [Aminiphilus sp.]|uniref:hypothetical protein n=1 Tax=Aminiphilus sp. TaxID=1872488 RepID=UPI0026170ED4|nr:hypothetical protein [Aminiphilus sp.]
MREVTSILERHTAFRWGEDCLIWVVHYPEELVDPWVRLEAAKRGFSAADAATYKQSFLRDLRMGDSEPVLLTVYQFGGSPLSLAPLSEHLALVNDRGERFTPSSYDDSFDGALSGVVQGLVFFPRQEGTFTLSLSGVAGEEQVFAFSGMSPTNESVAASSDIPAETVVVTLGEDTGGGKTGKDAPQGAVTVAANSSVPKKEEGKKTPLPQPKKPEEDIPPPPPFLVMPSAPVPIQGGTATAVPPQGTPAPSGEVALDEFLSSDEVISEISLPVASGEQPLEEAVPTTGAPERLIRLSRQQTVEKFLQGWVAGDVDAMYELLTKDMRVLYTRDAFGKRVLEGSFRWALKEGYVLSWPNETVVKVSAAQKLLVMRVLRSEVLRLVEEQGIWRISW